MTIEELNKYKENGLNKLRLRLEKNATCKIYVGAGDSGIEHGSRKVLEAMLDEAANLGLENLMITQMGSIGEEEYEPIVEVYDKDGVPSVYGKVTPEIGRKIVSEAVQGKVLDEYLLSNLKK